MADTDELDVTEEEKTGQEKMAVTVAEYMIRNWTPDQVLEFALRLLGTFSQGIVVQTFRIYMTRFLPREDQVNFCLHMLGDEAQAWWARKQGHQS